MNPIEWLLYGAAHELLMSGRFYYWQSPAIQAALKVLEHAT